MGVRRGVKTGVNPGGAIEAIAPLEIYKFKGGQRGHSCPYITAS